MNETVALSDAQDGLDSFQSLTRADSSDGKRRIRIFVSSPIDVAEEREKARDVIDHLARLYQDQLEIESYLYEDKGLPATEPPQDSVENPADCDVVIVILWARMGTELTKDGVPYLSGTDYEYQVACKAYREKRKPHILVYKKQATPRPPESGNLDDLREFTEQWGKVESFFEKHFAASQGSGVRGAFEQFENSEEFEQTLQKHLESHLQIKLRSGKEKIEGDPYVGLRPLDVSDASKFFGREAEISEILGVARRKVRSPNHPSFVLIWGNSGSGKSSLVRAGLIPRIRRRDVIDPFENWRLAILSPSTLRPNLVDGFVNHICRTDVLPELGQVLQAADESGVPRDEIISQSQLGEALDLAGIADQGKFHKPPFTGLLVVIDQLEEVFASNPPDLSDNLSDEAKQELAFKYRTEFFELLLRLADVADSRILILATIRTDFLSECDSFASMRKLQKDGFNLPQPSPAQIRSMIRQPALHAGYSFEARDQIFLDEKIAEDAMRDHTDQGALPLLAFALKRLFEANVDNHVLEYKEYKEIGGLDGALHDHAERAYKGWATLHPHNAESIFSGIMRLLIDVVYRDGKQFRNKRTASFEEMEKIEGGLGFCSFMLEEKQRLVVKSEDGYGLAHEALLRQWPQIQKWLAKNDLFFPLKGRLEHAIEQWRTKKDAAGLWHEGENYSMARQLLSDFPDQVKETPEAEPFLIASLDEHQRRREAAALSSKQLKRLLAATAILLIATLGFAIWGVLKNLEADKHLQLAEEREEAMNRALAEANERERETSKLFDHYISAVDRGSSKPEHLPFLVRALEVNPHKRLVIRKLFSKLMYRNWVFPTKEPVRGADGHDILYVAASSGELGTEYSARATSRTIELYTNAKLVDSIAVSESISCISYSNDSRFIAAGLSNGGVMIWECSNGNLFFDAKNSVEENQEFQRDNFPRSERPTDEKPGEAIESQEDRPSESIKSERQALNRISSVDFHPSGQLLLTASDDGKVRVWDLQTKSEKEFEEPIKPPSDGSDVHEAYFSPGGEYILTASGRSPQLYSTETGKHLTSDEHAAFVHSGPLRSAKFVDRPKDSGAGAWYVSTGGDGNVKLWIYDEGNDFAVSIDLQTGESPGSQPMVLEASNKRGWLLVGYDSGTVLLWRTGDLVPYINAAFERATELVEAQKAEAAPALRAAASQIKPIDPSVRSSRSQSPIRCAAFDPFGYRVAAASASGEIEIFHLGPSADPDPFEIGDDIADIAFRGDGKRLRVLGKGGELQEWSVASTQALGFSIDSEERIGEFSYCQNSDNYLTIGKKRCFIRNISERGDGFELTHPISAGFLDCKLDRVIGISKTWNDKKVRLFNSHGKLLQEHEPSKKYAPTVLACCVGRKRFATAAGRELQLWELNDEGFSPLAKEAASFPSMIAHLALSPNGKTAVVKCRDQLPEIMTITEDGSAEKVAELTGLPVDAAINSVRYCPNGRYLTICAGSIGYMWEIDPNTGKLIAGENEEAAPKEFGHRFPVDVVAYNRDGSKVATGSRDRTIRIWDTVTGRPTSSPLRHGSEIRGMDFDKDERLVSITAHNTIYLWNASASTQKMELIMDPMDTNCGELRGVNFSSQENIIFVAGSKGIEQWDVSGVSSVNVTDISLLKELVRAVSGYDVDKDFHLNKVPLSDRYYGLSKLLSERRSNEGSVESLVNWFLAEGPERKISPGSSTTRKVYLDRLEARFESAVAQGNLGDAEDAIWQMLRIVNGSDPRIQRLMAKLEKAKKPPAEKKPAVTL